MTKATLPGLIRDGTLDAALGALLWSLAGAGVQVHVVAPERRDAERLAEALRPVAKDADTTVTVGAGDALERVLSLPVPLRPATGAVVVVRDGIVVAAHLLRPPLRDAGGHVKPQAPAVLATAEPGGGWDHFAWGIGPELAGLVGVRAGDFDIDADRRRDYLAGLAEAGVVEAADVDTALRGYAFDRGPTSGRS